MGNKYIQNNLSDRRSTPRSKTNFYRIMVGLNILGWVALVVALILFHFARPDFISGVQIYWGIKGDTSWSQGYVDALLIMLQFCLGISAISLIMRACRTRRQGDEFGMNLIFLSGMALISLIILLSTMGSIR